MTLINILDLMGSLEKNSFIKVIDNIITEKPKNHKEIEKILSGSDKGLKSVDSQNISKIFSLIKEEYFNYLKCEFQETDSQFDILIDLIIRDGNCMMKQDWFSRLYELEVKSLELKVKKLNSELQADKSEDLTEERKRDYRIYKACLNTAYFNDETNNREAKVTSEELSIIVTLAKELGLSQEEIRLINYTILPIKKMDITQVINDLKNIGVIFFSKKENKVYIADEMVRLLRRLRKKDVADKYFRRILKLLNTSTINQISRNHNIDRNLTTEEKIEEIIKEGVLLSDVLSSEMHKPNTTLTERKKALNELCEKHLNITNLKGSTIEEKISYLIEHFELIENDEKVGISIDGFQQLLIDLNKTLPKLNAQIRKQFQFQEEFVLEANLLLDYNIKPRDILDLIQSNNIKLFIKENGVKQRGDDTLNILEHYKDADNLFLENYENIAYRNLNQLKDNGLEVRESELGIKFEELTKNIFKELAFNVDEELRKKVNTSKDQIDILLNLGNDEVIIAECKTVKEKGYNKFSTVSRQLKSYNSLCEKNNLRVLKVLLVAPEFSDDFITDCEIFTELNISLLTASSFLKIYNEFKISKFEEFPYVLFRDIVINEDRIIKALKKK